MNRFFKIGNAGISFANGGPLNIDLSSGPPPGDITVALSASRLSGPAPLAVHFSAIGTTTDIVGVTDSFRQLLYTFDYGDAGSGAWPISGGSKNQDVGGPLGAHVFQTPGTYTVRCTASRGGDSSYQEVTITVADPDTVYAGTNTIFVSTSGNYAGAPAGASTVTSTPTIVSNRRYMLRPGESFGALTIPHGVTGTQVVAAPLAGAKPVVSSVQVGAAGLPPNSSFPDDITIAGLELSGGLTQSCSVNRLLLLNLSQPSNFAYTFAGAIGYWADASRYGPTMPLPKEIFIVGCTSAGSTSAAGLFGDFHRSAMMGCDFKSAVQHTVRFFSAAEAIIAHNDLSGPSSDGVRHSLKLHSEGDQPLTPGMAFGASGPNWASRHIVIANNVLGDTDDNNQMTVVIGPQNAIVSEGLEDIIVEANTFITGTSTVSDLEMSGRRMTYINNVKGGGGAASVSPSGPHVGGLPGGDGGSWDGQYYTSRT